MKQRPHAELEETYARALQKVVSLIHARFIRALEGGEIPPAREVRTLAAKIKGQAWADARALSATISTTAKKLDRANSIQTARTIAALETPERKPKVKDASDDAAEERRLIKQFTERNAKLVTNMTAEATDRIAKLIEERAGQRWEQVAGMVEGAAGVNSRRADLIARDQLLTLNANLTQARHEALGITEYIWSTAGENEERVRAWHAELDGQQFSYDDPPLGGGTAEDDYGNPGEGINCRCAGIPVIPLFEGID